MTTDEYDHADDHASHLEEDAAADASARDTDDWTHPRLTEPDDDMPDVLTPLDRINPLTGQSPTSRRLVDVGAETRRQQITDIITRDHARQFGTVTGRITPNDPKPQHLPGIGVPGLNPRVIERNVLLAMDLLEQAADLVHRALHTEPAPSSELHRLAKAWESDGATWLEKYRELTENER